MTFPTENPNAPTMAGLRLIVIALLVSQVLFGGVIAFLSISEGGVEVDSGGGLRYVSYAAAGSMLLLVPSALVTRSAMWSGLSRLPEDQRMARYAMGVMVSMATLEGCALFNLIAWMLTDSLALNLPCAAVCFFVQVVLFPTQQQFEDASR